GQAVLIGMGTLLFGACGSLSPRPPPPPSAAGGARPVVAAGGRAVHSEGAGRRGPTEARPGMAELPYRIVIGLEAHVQLLTRTKLFCGCRTTFNLPPNSATCPVCLGLPGSLPVMNRRAFELALRAALALNCRVAAFTKWDRKNYYYPDLPKNYQISQYDLPFSADGWLKINAAADPKKAYTPKRVGIIRAHLEEDAGKLLHDESGRGGDSKVDLNRTGTPLLEIVSRPEINSPEEAKALIE